MTIESEFRHEKKVSFHTDVNVYQRVYMYICIYKRYTSVPPVAVTGPEPPAAAKLPHGEQPRGC